MSTNSHYQYYITNNLKKIDQRTLESIEKYIYSTLFDSLSHENCLTLAKHKENAQNSFKENWVNQIIEVPSLQYINSVFEDVNELYNKDTEADTMRMMLKRLKQDDSLVLSFNNIVNGVFNVLEKHSQIYVKDCSTQIHSCLKQSFYLSWFFFSHFSVSNDYEQSIILDDYLLSQKFSLTSSAKMFLQAMAYSIMIVCDVNSDINNFISRVKGCPTMLAFFSKCNVAYYGKWNKDMFGMK